MDPSSSVKNKRPLTKTRILFLDGFWWFQDSTRERPIKLDPLFHKCQWKVGKLARSLGLEKRTLSRLIEESLGIKSKAWLCSLRAVVACHLLREQGKIETTAAKLGFSDDSNFTREFKKIVGVKPSFYMQSEKTRSHLNFNDL